MPDSAGQAVYNKMQHFYQKIATWPESDPLKLFSFIISKSKEGQFVEIGSWMGCSAVCMAVEIINSNKPIKLHCVDHWKGSPEHQKSHPPEFFNSLLEKFKKNITPVQSVIEIHQMESTQASKLFKDNSLQFVYIDANHSYESVTQDILHWLPKVKCGGFIGGDDFNLKTVRKSVEDNLLGFNTIGEYWFFHKLKIY